MPMPAMTPLNVGLMILFMVLFMFLAMFVIHGKVHHHKQYSASSHKTANVFPIINWAIKMLLHLGVRMTILGPLMLLTVRGRKTGEPRTIPVDLHEHDGRRFLIATHGEGNWVRNLRAAGEGVLSLGRHRQTFTAVELAPEMAASVMKEVLGPLLASQGVRGLALRRHFGMTPAASLNDFINAASNHPVFELAFPTKV